MQRLHKSTVRIFWFFTIYQFHGLLYTLHLYFLWLFIFFNNCCQRNIFLKDFSKTFIKLNNALYNVRKVLTFNNKFKLKIFLTIFQWNIIHYISIYTSTKIWKKMIFIHLIFYYNSSDTARMKELKHKSK